MMTYFSRMHINNIMLAFIVVTTLFSVCSSSEEQSVLIDLKEYKALWGLADGMEAVVSRRELVEPKDVYFGGCNDVTEKSNCQGPFCVWLTKSSKCVADCEDVLTKEECESREECTFRGRNKNDPKFKPGCYFKTNKINKCSDVRSRDQCESMSPRCFFSKNRRCSSICRLLSKRRYCKEIRECTIIQNKCVEKGNLVEVSRKSKAGSCEGLKKAPCMELEKCMFKDDECMDIGGSD